MSTKNTFEINGNEVTIRRAGWKTFVQTTYRDDYYPELISHVWSIKNGYPTNDTLGGGLHRYIMGKWYGKKMLDELTSKGYVVDHINNNHCDCRIENLEFLKKDYNTAKGQQLDKDIPRLSWNIALSIFKDFGTGCYQITIGCNDPISGKDNAGNEFMVDSFKFLYTGDYNNYPIVLNDAEGILLDYEREKRFSLLKTKAAAIRVYKAPQIILTEEEKQQAIITRNGHPFVVIGNGKNYMVSIHPDLSWRLPDDYDGKQKISFLTPIIQE